MKAILFVICVAAVFPSGSRRGQETFQKISVSEFELVDRNGTRRASIKVEETGEVVFRLLDRNGTIRMKMGASEDGSGLLLLDHNTEPSIHALAGKNGAQLTMTDQQGKKRAY